MKPDDATSPSATTRRWYARLRWHKLNTLVTLGVAMAIWGWVDVRVRGQVDPNDLGLHKSDFTVYTEAGAAFFDGRQPYEVTNPRGWGYLYPPAFAMLVAPLHSLLPQVQVLIWFVLSTLMVYGCYSESLRVARWVLPDRPQHPLFGPVPSWVGWSAVVASLLPAFNCLQRGQVGVAKLYLLLLGFRLYLESRGAVRAFLAGCVLALPIVLKISPLVPVGFLLVEQLLAAWFAKRPADALPRAGALTAGVACGLVMFLLVVPASLVGWRTNLSHLDTWWRTVAVRLEDTTSDFAGDSSSLRNQSLVNATERLGNWIAHCFASGPNDIDPTMLRNQGVVFPMDAPVVGRTLLAVRLAAGLLLLVMAYRVARYGDDLAMAAAFGVACVSTLVLAPIVRGHYYVLLLPAIMYTGAWLWRSGRENTALAIATVPAVLSVTHYVLLDYAGRIGLLGLGTATWYVACCILLALGNRRAGATAVLHEESLQGAHAEHPLAA